MNLYLINVLSPVNALNNIPSEMLIASLKIGTIILLKWSCSIEEASDGAAIDEHKVEPSIRPAMLPINI